MTKDTKALLKFKRRTRREWERYSSGSMSVAVLEEHSGLLIPAGYVIAAAVLLCGLLPLMCIDFIAGRPSGWLVLGCLSPGIYLVALNQVIVYVHLGCRFLRRRRGDIVRRHKLIWLPLPRLLVVSIAVFVPELVLINAIT